MSADRDAVLDATDLAALADELLGPRRGTTVSAKWSCPNPAHAQTGRTPPLGIFRAHNGEERWHCHGCGIGGTAIDLVMAVRGSEFRDALDELAGRSGLRDWTPQTRQPPMAPRARRPPPRPNVTNPEGLRVYVQDCATRLWRPDGTPVLRWLTERRRLPEDVLRVNAVGADPGKKRQPRPDGMPAGGWAAVLPAFDAGHLVFAQLRSLNAFPQRYLNAASTLATNPRLAFYEPPEPIGSCLVVAEGAIDGLSANAAGFRSAVLLGTGHAHRDQPGDDIAERLAATRLPIAVALDADPAGDDAARRLVAALRDRGAHVARVHVPAEHNDLNRWMRHTRDWPRTFATAIRTSMTAARVPRGLARS